jgi:hypothetical protein
METLKPEFQRFIDEWKVDPVAQKQVRLKEENKCHNFEWWDKYVMMRLTGRHYPWHIDNKKYSQLNCGNHKAKTCALCPGEKGRGWCHGDCAWCDATDKCIEYDDAQKPECKKKPTTKSPEVKKVQRALVLAGFENKMTISVVLPCGFEHDFFATIPFILMCKEQQICENCILNLIICGIAHSHNFLPPFRHEGVVI